MKKICFTGYRPYKLPFKICDSDEHYNAFYKRASDLITAQIELGNSYYISGMAQGADLILGGIVLNLKKTYSNIFLECALPFPGQSDNWQTDYKEHYQMILKGCDKITVLSQKYSINSFYLRNRYMVDNSDIVIAVFDGKKGGTKYTCDYATKKGKQVLILNPSSQALFFQINIDGL